MAMRISKDRVDLDDKELQRPVLKDYGEAVVTSGSGSNYTIDLEHGNVHDITLNNNCAFTFANPPASGTAGSFTLFLTQDATGSRTVTWPAAVEWVSGTEPTLKSGANELSIVTFITLDGGTTWHGIVVTGAGGSVETADLADGAVTFPKLADAAVVTEAEGISSNDNDTTVPTSAAVVDHVENNAGGSGSIIASGSFSSVANLDIPLDGDTWDVVEIYFMELSPTTTGVNFNVLFEQSGSFVTGASDYYWGYSYGAGDISRNASDSKIEIATDAEALSIANKHSSIKVSIPRPQQASVSKSILWYGSYFDDSANDLIFTSGAGVLDKNKDAIDAVRFEASSGNIEGYYVAIGHKY